MRAFVTSHRIKVALLAVSALVVAKSLVSGAMYDAEIRIERNIYAHQADAWPSMKASISPHFRLFLPSC